MTHGEKKSESLDVRLSLSEKRSLMETARARGETASEAVRRMIGVYLSEVEVGATPNSPKGWIPMLARNRNKATLMAATVLAAGFSLTLLPTAAADERVFETLDRNADGVLTPGEIAPQDDRIFDVLDTDRSRSITRDEFAPVTVVSTVADSVRNKGDGPPVRVITVEQTKIEVQSAGQSNVWTSTASDTVSLDAGDEEVRQTVLVLQKKLDEQPERPAPTTPN